jgi:cytochrome c
VARCEPFAYHGGDFSLKLNGDSKMKYSLMLLAAGAFAAGSAEAALDNNTAEAMMKKDGCAACHAVDKKVIGPAYQEVAAKYKGDAKAAAMLADKVKKGGVGVWGQIPMPPNAQVSDADIKDLVAWILTLKK